MTAEQVIADAFLVVSVMSFVVQAWALRGLRRRRVRGGVWRTAICRVGCAVIYVGVGINALRWHWATLQVTFIAFLITQLTWQANAWLDVHKAEKPVPRGGRHRAARRRIRYV